MGYGCPDNNGGVCDANFYGLYNQLYKAAWQFKRYSTPDPWGNYQPGTEYIQYHPDSACGTQKVVVQNNATAALYNYTPYVPNAAALANLRTTGDGCSSYGNRNFWVFYNDWFGSPVTTVPPGVTVERRAGADRFDVSVEVSKAAFAAGVPVLYIADGLNFPDALSAGAAAAHQGGPLLIVRPQVIPASVRAEIVRLQPQKIVVVGGPSSVSSLVFEDLRTLTPSITRIDGADRYEVSRNLAEFAFGDGSAVAYVANGGNFPDALSAGAAASSKGAPVILLNGVAPTLDASTKSVLETLGSEAVFITGGPPSVSPGIEVALKSVATNVVRFGGADRYVVSGGVNRQAFTSAATLYVAIGTTFPDALSGVPVAALGASPLYIIPATCIPTYVLDDIRTMGVKKMVILGGVGSLSSRIEQFTGC
jgi:putative cell wall-binding protein